MSLPLKKGKIASITSSLHERITIFIASGHKHLHCIQVEWKKKSIKRTTTSGGHAYNQRGQRSFTVKLYFEVFIMSVLS